jgi:Domain of unknown function (DUF4440)
LLHVRETVWRAWFTGDTKTLEGLIPPESIVMIGGEEKWKNQADVLHSAAEFHANGGKLVRLEFPHTEVQHFGDVAIVWSQYLAETETNGKPSSDCRLYPGEFLVRALSLPADSKVLRPRRPLIQTLKTGSFAAFCGEVAAWLLPARKPILSHNTKTKPARLELPQTSLRGRG